MRLFILTLFISFFSSLNAQQLSLSDSVMYVDKTPVAFYHKYINETAPRYNLDVYNLNHVLLIKANLIKFEAPVHDLKSFYYYELSFPTAIDTCNIYVEDEAFPLVMLKLIQTYHLFNGNQIDYKGLSKFKTAYSGVTALQTKIKSVDTYLNETRRFNQQVVRDRTKPVIIVNDRVIMQDSVKIGIISKGSFQVFLINQTAINLNTLGGQTITYPYSKLEYGQALFEKSLPFNNTALPGNETYLKTICYLIENYAL
jgi:hypothetical protein